MEDWVVLRDSTLSHSDEDEEEEEVTIACSTDPSDRVIALSSSSDASSTDQGSSDDYMSEDDNDDDNSSDDYSDYDDRLVDEEAYDQFVTIDSPKHKHQEEEEERINRIAHLVLPRLPAKSLLRFKSVSPNFNHLISSPFMVLSHFLHANTLSGLFYRAQWNKTRYLSFDAPSTDLPDPALSYLPEPVLIKASTHGMLCVRGLESLRFYITNPTTMEWVEIPDSADYDDNVAVVVVFDEPSVYNFSGDYRVVFAYPVDSLELGGVYTFRTFSSDKWAWIQSEEVCEVENIMAESGIGVGAMAYWRTSHETLVRYDPVKDRSHIMQRPHANMHEVWWELGEMEGKLSVTSQSNEDEIMISTAVANKGEDDLDWKVMGNFWLSRNTNATAIRSQGSAQLVLWEEKTYVAGAVPGVVLRDMQGEEVHSFAEPKEYTSFVPYISTLVPVKRPGAGTSTEHLVKSSGMLVEDAIGKIGEEALKSLSLSKSKPKPSCHPICYSASAASQTQPSTSFRMKPPSEVTVLVTGATGYIGRVVVRELLKRGHRVIAVARERSGIRGRDSRDDTLRRLSGATVCFSDVTDPDTLSRDLASLEGISQIDAAVCCLASRNGGIKDSWKIDYEATKNTLTAARKNGANHFVLLSAICVQKPLLEFQRAKLKFEAELQTTAETDPSFTYSIVRPTAFFKSLGGQVEIVKDGKPYVMFGDGKLCACKPISEEDLASFIADCVMDEDKSCKVLPIGGPGKALTPLEQGELLFQLLGKEPKFFKVPIEIMDFVIGVLDFFAKVFPGLEDAAEFGRIGRYYAAESMLVWDPETGEYSAEQTPSYGKDTLEDFFAKVIREGMAGQELGEQTIF